MHTYIATQHADNTFQLALFKGDQRVDIVTEDKRHTSQLFIPLLDQLLSKNVTTLAEIAFFAVNCGPGPFSTLRSIIASVNGLHCATNIPLIGIDGLEATFLEFYDPAYENTIVLLNAFNNESYYLIARNTSIIATGYKKTELLTQEIAKKFPHGTVNIIDNRACSIETIARLGYEKYVAQKPLPSYLMPLHLKKHPVEL